MRTRVSRITAIQLTIAIAAAGCAASGSSIDEPDAATPLSAPPQRIVSLSPSSTEILYALGADEQVVAVDTYSNHPPGLPTTEMSGFDPNVEALVDLDPDLVVVSGDRNDVVAGLGAVDVPVLVHPSPDALEDVWTQIITLGEATGHLDAADALVEEMRGELDELSAGLPREAAGLTYYHEVSGGYYTATSDTFVGQLYGMLGLVNIADAAAGAANGGNYPQLSAEFVVDADPDMIFLSGTREDVEEPADERPGWDTLRAVRDDAVTYLDPDVASRWGPRIVEQVATVRAAVMNLLATRSE